MPKKKSRLKNIPPQIASRDNVFYWQTDREIEPQQAGEIWSDRHGYFTDDEIVERVNSELVKDSIAALSPWNEDSQMNLGNINSVRMATLKSGRKVIVRCHPKGIPNGYFHVESAAAKRAKKSGLPSYGTLAIHDYERDDDFAFQVIEELPGIAVKVWLASHSEDEKELLSKIGKMMAKLHQIKVEGYGPFDNDKAKNGKLIGRHKTLGESIQAGLNFNLKVLVDEKLLTPEQVDKIESLFNDDNPTLTNTQPVLVHNDFADWNLLTDGKDITGILDWDECVASDPILDIACWSSFFDLDRLETFLRGYWKIAEKPDDFDEKFELFRLRYILSKMTLRLRRYSWDPSDFMASMIEIGKKHLAQSLDHFELAKD